MKIEIAESLCYSYMRHVKRCLLVQTNWKTSPHWATRKSASELEQMFQEMRIGFDQENRVFKGTSSAAQLMQQGEIDVIGVDQSGNIHALDVAFHERGLDYGGENTERVLKKVLRTYLVLNAYHPAGTKYHVYFASPKVGPGTQTDLENEFKKLSARYPETGWHLMTNVKFSENVLNETLASTGSVADSSELFARSAKLLDLSKSIEGKEPGAASFYGQPEESNAAEDTGIRPLVHGLMLTLLEKYPTILDEEMLSNLMDEDYCKRVLQLRISNLALVRKRQLGRSINGHYRYWKGLYAGRFYVCSQWWKVAHLHNAKSLLRFVESLSREERRDPEIGELEKHEVALRKYIAAG